MTSHGGATADVSPETQADGKPGVRVLIVDDHGVLRAGLRLLLSSQPRLQVVGEAAEGHQAVEMARELKPDLVLLDVGMPGMDGLQVAAEIKAATPATRILILTVHEDPAILREAIQRGAAGYVVKRAVEAELMSAIDAVLRGDLYVDPIVTRALFTEAAAPADEAKYEDVLTPREIEVLQLIAQGYTNTQVADQLGLSVRTVENHRANLTDKLNIRNRAGLVHYARRHGLLKG